METVLTISGTVVRGKGEARTLGYPTANLLYASDRVPDDGVWVCRAEVDGVMYDGLAVIGMWKQENHLPSVEVHLLDVALELYEKTLNVRIATKLRDLMAFANVAGLIAQIEKDIQNARLCLPAS